MSHFCTKLYSHLIKDRHFCDSSSTVIIDVGKNFLAAALEWFPKYGLRHIDAVLITHAHADGMSSGSIIKY